MGAWPTQQYSQVRGNTTALWIPRTWHWTQEYQTLDCDVQHTLTQSRSTRIVILAPQAWRQDPNKLQPLCHASEFKLNVGPGFPVHA